MTTTLERFATVADGFGRLVAECPPERWDSPSPCPPWTASDVVDHVLDGFEAMLSAVDRPAPSDPNTGRLDRWNQTIAAMIEAINDPDAAATVVPSPMGDFAFKQVAGGVMLHDMLAHTWDLARATGQGETLDAEAVTSALTKMTPFDDLLRGPDMFGPKITTPADADPQTELLCFLGRRVHDPHGR